MEMTQQQIAGARYFDEKYDIIFMQPLVTGAKLHMIDAPPPAPRVCRFCGKTEPEVTFAKEAHAIPEFLVNKSLISMNECDACNEYIANNAENDLADWFGALRSASQMLGKRGVPTYDMKGVKIEMTATGLAISITAPVGDSGITEGESVDFTLPVETPSRPLTLVNAAKALVKMACSVAPVEELPQLKGAIDWIMGRTPVGFKDLPIVFAFTPGANPYGVGMVILCRRKVSQHAPYLWCVVASYNVNFQFFVPFCPGDKMDGKDITFTSVIPFPTPFPADSTHGPTKWHLFNWASDVKAPVKQTITFHAEKVTQLPAPSPSSAPQVPPAL